MHRRRFLALATLAAPALILPYRARALADRVPLRHPALNEGRDEAGTRVFDLIVAEAETEFLPGESTRTLGINRSFLGDVLGMRTGDTVRMNVTNRLAEPMALHWHGMHLPAAMDGGPHQPVAPGETWSPEWQIRQPATTLWYHGHQLHKTAEHVWRGMAGAIRVAGDEPPGLPADYGVDDFTLVLQDRSFDAEFQMPYAPGMHDMMAGYMGNRPLVNGTLDARLEVPRGTVRFRLVNGSNGSFYSLRFADGRMMTQIGSDGGLLPAPVTGATLLLAPAERAEILVDFADNRTVMLQAAAWGSETGPASATLVDFLDIRPVLADRGLFAAPGRLSELAPPDPDASVNRRDLVLEMRRGMGMSFTINDRLMDMARIDFTVPVDTVETWTIRNTTPMFHPIHIHDTQFRILSRNGAPPPSAEAGLKDTVLTAPGEVVEVQCRFADYADPVVPYMFHCHVLEHEDAGMMGQFTVV